MYRYILSFSIVLLFAVFSCKVQKKAKPTNADQVEIEAQMTLDGYVKAVVVFSADKEEPCDYLVKIENGNLLEPLSLDEKFKSDNQGIWLKYTPQRRASRCGEAQPVELNDIRKRDK